VRHSTEKQEILVVDDDTESTEVLAQLLTREGYAVARAENGREALEYLEHSRRPCLIILDLVMPVMSGWEFRKRQESDPKLKSLPVVVVSGTGPVKGLHAPVLRKPVDFGRLMKAVEENCLPA
jgi:CheY-like chemotaxis protein